MYTVVIADDEEELRGAIVRKVDWQAVGFKVVGEAENGIEALELVEKLEPDLLITDIKMPFISGIELARRVREIRPSMHIAFLSGYDDFKYAQQAIQYNIISYLLKPISLEELTKEMGVIKEKIDKKFMEFGAKGQGVSSLRANEPEIAEFLMSLLMDDSSDVKYSGNVKESVQSEIDRRLMEYKIKRSEDDEPCYVVMVTRFETDDGSICTLPHHVRAVNMVLRKYVRFGSFYSNGKIVSLLAEGPQEIGKYVSIIVNEVIQNIERVLKMKCSVGISREMDRLSKCSMAYGEAMAALGYAKEGTSAAYYIADVEHNNDFEYEYIEHISSKLENLLKVSDKTALETFLSNLFDDMKEKHIAKSNIDLLVMQVISTVYRAVSAVSDANATTELLSKSPIARNIFMSSSLDEIKTEMIDFCAFAKDIVANQRKMNSEIICDRALEIINTDFGDEDLSLVSLSERLHISSNYLSTLIKKTSGDTFTNLLTEKRMNVAKEYLMCTSMKILEIAYKCGYSDQHYFSYCFKKFFGMSPNKMRESKPDDENMGAAEEA